MPKRSKSPKAVKAWAGVCDGKIHRWGKTNGNYYELYPSRAQAKQHYDEVVQVTITPHKD